jgi:predicted amidohydrolase YtcJ
MNIDYAFLNGLVYTLEGHIAEAVAISGDKFAATGSNSEIRGLCDSKTEIIDLKGKYVFPGFNDSHMHLLLYGLMFDKIDLRGACSIEEIIKRGRSFIEEKNKKPGEFIIGYGLIILNFI